MTRLREQLNAAAKSTGVDHLEVADLVRKFGVRDAIRYLTHLAASVKAEAAAIQTVDRIVGARSLPASPNTVTGGLSDWVVPAASRRDVGARRGLAPRPTEVQAESRLKK